MSKSAEEKLWDNLSPEGRRILYLFTQYIKAGRIDEFVAMMKEAQAEPEPVTENVSELRREMQRHHPDRGGDPEKFRAAQEKYSRVRKRCRAAGGKS